MTSYTEIVHNQRDNVINVVLYEDGAPIDTHAEFTRVVVEAGIGNLLSDTPPIATFDSDVNPEYFDLNDPDKLVLKLGSQSAVKGRVWCNIILYSVAAGNGVVWEPPMEIDFR